MITIAQDNNTSPQTLDEMFTQEEQKALEERGFLGTKVKAPTVEKAPTAGELLVAYLESIIDKRVEEKVSQIMSSHATIALISDEQKELIRSAIEERLFDHENEHDHDEFCTTEGVNNIVENAISDLDIDHAVRRTIDSSNIVEDIVDNKIDDIDWEEKVREGLGNILG
jgi:hypothetical protein